MRMEHLQYLIEIGRRHSISAAAQELYLGQTTLSSIVKSAEDELGFPLFYRTHSGVQATAEGDEALSLIGDIHACYEKILQLNAHSNDTAPIPLILSPTVNALLALPLNRMFLEKEPQGNLEFRTVNGDEVGSMIIKNEGNIGVVHFGQPQLESYRAVASRYHIEIEVLLRDQLCLLVREDHPLASRERIAVQDVTHCHFAILPHFDASGDSLATIKSFDNGNLYTIFPNVTLIQEAVRDQNMVAILSRCACAKSQSHYPLRAIQLKDTPRENDIFLCLIHRDERHLHRREKTLAECIRAYFLAEDPAGTLSGTD